MSDMLADLRARGYTVTLSAEGRIALRSTSGTLAPEVVMQVRANKDELISALTAESWERDGAALAGAAITAATRATEREWVEQAARLALADDYLLIIWQGLRPIAAAYERRDLAGARTACAEWREKVGRFWRLAAQRPRSRAQRHGEASVGAATGSDTPAPQRAAQGRWVERAATTCFWSPLTGVRTETRVVKFLRNAETEPDELAADEPS